MEQLIEACHKITDLMIEHRAPSTKYRRFLFPRGQKPVIDSHKLNKTKHV